jgi:hypothetical protein
LDAPALPLAISSATRCSFDQPRRQPFSSRYGTSLEFCPPLEYYPAKPSRPDERPRPPYRSAPLMGFRSLRHIKDRRSTSRESCQTRFVPPAGFGYPLGGLRPPSPCRPCFVPAAPLGFAPSELPPPAKYPGRYRPEGPTCRFASRYSRWRAAGRTGWPRLLGFDPGERPWRLTRV